MFEEDATIVLQTVFFACKSNMRKTNDLRENFKSTLNDYYITVNIRKRNMKM
jgi:hypothetical protein